jgi:hypothetical protein
VHGGRVYASLKFAAAAVVVVEGAALVVFDAELEQPAATIPAAAISTTNDFNDTETPRYETREE